MYPMTCEICGGKGGYSDMTDNHFVTCGACNGTGQPAPPARGKVGDALVPSTRGAGLNLPLAGKPKTAAELRKELAEVEAREAAEWQNRLTDCPEDLLRAECKRRGWIVYNIRSPQCA